MSGFMNPPEAGAARGYIFGPKIPIWENFVRLWNAKGWFILWQFGIYYGLLVHFIAIW
jgi:hypothetical protein